MKQPIIVIGSGIAGLNFALSAADFSDVLVITKKKMVESATNYAQGGIAAVIDRADNFEQHVTDTMDAGAGHNNKRAVEYMVKNGPEAIRRLIEFGVNFHTTNGRLELRREGGHGRRRIAFVGDYTGKDIEHALAHHVRTHPRITIWEDTFAIDLLVHPLAEGPEHGEPNRLGGQRGGGRGKNSRPRSAFRRCYGVSVKRGGRVKNIFGRATVLATGGLGQIFKYTTNPPFSTGDGYAMAARAGCHFRDMEFIQFHPTALNLGRGKRLFLLSEALRGDGAHIVNKDGERFLKKYHKDGELAPRDIVARACFEEEHHGPIYLDLRHLDQGMLKVRFPQIHAKLRDSKLNPAKDLIPTTPAAHYCCGGVKVNFKGETGIDGLYAFGEVAGTGVHGANRLASNSLLEAIVFSSRIAAELQNARSSRTTPNFATPYLTGSIYHSTFGSPSISTYRPGLKSSGTRNTRIKNILRTAMWDTCGIIRDRAELKKTHDLLLAFSGDFADNAYYNDYELRNMIETSLLVVEAALKRKKSLGAHHIA